MKKEIKKRIHHRIKIIDGQLKGLQKMITEDQYCMDILTQNLAVQKSLASLNKLVLENHIRTHITDMLGSRKMDERENALQEILQLYELHKNRSK